MFACLYSPLPEKHAAIERVARDFSPRIERQQDGLVVLDISGLERLIGPPRVIAAELFAAAGERLGVAATRIAAQLLARAHAGVTFAEAGTEAATLAPLSVNLLRALDVPPDLLDTLERWGIRTLGEFAALPSQELSARLGQDGLRWQRMARGEDARPLVPTLPEERFEAMLDLEWPIEGIEPLAFVLSRLLDSLCTHLEARDRAATALVLRLRHAITREWQSRRLELSTPMRDARMLRTLICLDLEGHPPEAVVDRVGLFVEPAPGRICQFSLLTKPTLAPEEAATLMARLRALMGQDRCGTPRLVDTHRPGAFAMAEFVPFLSRSTSSTPARPIVIDWIAPQLSRRRTTTIRRLRQPIPARVIVEQGRPVRVTTDGRGWNGGRVLWTAGPWHSSGDWWTPDPWNHLEWDVALSDGAVYRIHENRLQMRWFVAAILD
jgi:protein ImuB